jgi:putative endonuclease
MATHTTAAAQRQAQRQALGRYGESLAARHLTGLGMVVLDHNWRCPAGEIDLVLRDGRVLVICEVKTRSSTACGTPFEAVTATKLERLRRLAAHWLDEHPVRPLEVRIDMVGIIRPRSGPSSDEHVKGIG